MECLAEAHVWRTPKQSQPTPIKANSLYHLQCVCDHTVEQPENKLPDPIPKAQGAFRPRFRLYRCRSRGLEPIRNYYLFYYNFFLLRRAQNLTKALNIVFAPGVSAKLMVR